MKQKLLDQILEKCQIRHNEEQDELENEEIEKECKTYKKYQYEHEFQKAFFGTNYRKENKNELENN